MTEQKIDAAAEELTDEALEDAQGGIALLLPAVQKVREAARRTTNETTFVATLETKG